MSADKEDKSTELRSYLARSRPEYGQPSKRARLSYLYSDVSQARQNNPQGFASTVAWWSNLVHDIVTRGLQDGEGEASDKLIWHLDPDFIDRLRWDGVGRPTGLGAVTMELAQSSPARLMPVSSFLSSTKPIESYSLPGWIASKLIAAPLWWSMGKIGLVDQDGAMSEAKAWKLAQGNWVLLDPLKKAADSIAARLSANTTILDRLYSQESFIATFASQCLANVPLSSADMQILLKYLERDRRLLVQTKKVVKFLSPEERTSKEDVSVSEAEVGILQVKETGEALEEQIADLEKRIAERQDKITAYLKSNQKDLALSHLRSKKALLDLLSKRTLAQENISAILLKIESAESDAAVLNAYRSATTSLKALLANPVLQRENVENTMEDLQEALADQREVEEVITDGGKQAAQLDDYEDEIEQELAQLQREADERQKDARRVQEEHWRPAAAEKEVIEQHREKEPSVAESRAIPAEQKKAQEAERVPLAA